jgi:hypothetical protein
MKSSSPDDAMERVNVTEIPVMGSVEAYTVANEFWVWVIVRPSSERVQSGGACGPSSSRYSL